MYYPARLYYSLLSVQRRFIVAGHLWRSRQVAVPGGSPVSRAPHAGSVSWRPPGTATCAINALRGVYIRGWPAQWAAWMIMKRRSIWSDN